MHILEKYNLISLHIYISSSWDSVLLFIYLVILLDKQHIFYLAA